MKRIITLSSVFALVASISYFVLTAEPKEKYVAVTEKVMPACVEIQVVVYRIHPIVQLLLALTGLPQTEEGLKELFRILGEDPTPENINQVLEKGTVLGSGVYVNSKGYILTCAHLFNQWYKVGSISVINVQNDTVAGTIVAVGENVDLAVIKTTYYHATPYVKLADPRKLKVGQEVIAIGSPLGLSFSVTNGIISALYRDFPHAYNVTQSNTAINPGNSGGPLFNLKGELVGINSFMVPPVNAAIFTGLGFSVQVGQCLEFLVQTSREEPELRNRTWIRLFYNWL